MAANIQSELDKRGLNAKDFAATLGFKYSTVLDWLHAKTYPRIDKIDKMAKYFGIDKSDLVESRKNKDKKPSNVELSDDDVIMTWRGKPLSDEDRELIRRIMNGK
ncbi:XRE family transcriptional regulator [Ligilactobacillus ruminis]|uniref:XRE family transcriptional regulator n=2 Tax=Ligilactobacillus ruminis TaxID=1623 RepID=A0A8B2Z5J4_9LACO|nr:XRE family transcriptional regulator [Ligilactobacillus ruminis]